VPFDAAALSQTEITVNNTAELKAAYILLAGQEGGGTIKLAPGEIFEISLKDLDAGEEPVVFTSADPSQQAHVEKIHLESVANVRVDNVYVDSIHVTDREEWRDDLLVKDSTNVQIVNSTFKHDADSTLTNEADKAETVGLFRSSSDVEFSGNTVSGYYNGVGFGETDKIVVSNNEISEMQGDGLRFGTVQDVEIKDNYIHSFYGSLNDLNHTDLIQFWGTSAGLTQDVTISGNVLMADDVAAQSIFIRNEQIKKDNAGSDYFTNFKITDNVVYNGNGHGISVADVDGLLVANNTIIWNPDAKVLWEGEVPTSEEPRLLVFKSINADVFDNVASVIVGNDTTSEDGNFILDYDDPESDNYVGKHVADPFGATELSDLLILPTSPAGNGTGAAGTQFPTGEFDGFIGIVTHETDPGDIHEYVFDAGLSVGADGGVTEEGYSFEWEFSDGTTANGIQVAKDFSGAGNHTVTLKILKGNELLDTVEHDFEVATKDIFELSFDSGLTDTSENGLEFFTQGAPGYVTGAVGKGFALGGDDKLKIEPLSSGLTDLDRFGLVLDMKVSSESPSGIFVYQGEGFEGEVLDDGRVAFSLTTDVGTYRMTSDEAVFNDGQWHKIGIGYDSLTGKMQMFADGVLVANVGAEGSTDTSTPGISFGHPFKESDSISAYFDNIVMSRDNSVAGESAEPADPADPQPVVDPVPVVVPVVEPVEPGPVAPSEPVTDPAPAPTVTDPAPAPVTPTPVVTEPTPVPTPGPSPVEPTPVGPTEPAPVTPIEPAPVSVLDTTTCVMRLPEMEAIISNLSNGQVDPNIHTHCPDGVQSFIGNLVVNLLDPISTENFNSDDDFNAIEVFNSGLQNLAQDDVSLAQLLPVSGAFDENTLHIDHEDEMDMPELFLM
jgi:hypothetical protein